MRLAANWRHSRCSANASSGRVSAFGAFSTSASTSLCVCLGLAHAQAANFSLDF
jgi:hypothetical protein